MRYRGSRAFVSTHHEQNKHPREHFIGDGLPVNFPFKQRLNNRAGIALALFLRELSRINHDFKRCGLGFRHAACHVWIVRKGHGVGPLEKLLTILEWNTQQLENRHRQ